MKKLFLVVGLIFVAGFVFAQNITTDRYRFAEKYNMGAQTSVTPLADGRSMTTTWGRMWDLYNTNIQPAIDVQTFFNTLLEEQNSSGRYRNDADINLEVYQMSIESDDDRKLIAFMDLNRQNIALMCVTDVPFDMFTMVYKLDGVWQVAFFQRTIIMR